MCFVANLCSDLYVFLSQVSSLLVVCLSVTFRSDSFSLELGDSTPIASFLDDEAGSSNHDGSPPTKKGTHSTANVEAQAIFLAE